MPRIPVFLAVLMALFLPITVCSADDEMDQKIGPHTLSEWLKILRSDEKWEIRQKSLIALEIAGPDVRGVIPAVRTALKEDKDERVRASAATTLGHLGGKAKDSREAMDGLVNALQTDKAGPVREACAAGIGHIAAEARAIIGLLAQTAVPALIAALKDQHEGTRTEAAEALVRFGPEAKEALPQLTAVLRDKSAGRFTREYAARAIGRLAPAEARTAVPALVETLTDKDSPDDLRKAAAGVLGFLGKEAGTAVSALAKSVHDRNADVRRAAALALEKIGPDALSALPDLQQAFKDDDRFVRTQALHTVGTFGRPAAKAVPALVEVFKDEVNEVRLAAVEALAKVAEKDDQAALTALKRLAQESQPPIREAAQSAIKKIQETP